MSQAARRILCAAAGAACFALAACAGTPRKAESPQQASTRVEGRSGTTHATQSRRRSPYAPAQEDLSKRGNYTAGGLYAPGVSDSAPTDGIPDVDQIPEPEVRDEPHSRYGNRSPYTVLGKTYRVLDNAEGYDEVGTASFYGNKFHGRRTSNLEVYDMYAFTAAHKTLPLPSFARVTNLANGRSVVVRINDRGPFHDGRIIDLSYAAAVKLGVDREVFRGARLAARLAGGGARRPRAGRAGIPARSARSGVSGRGAGRARLHAARRRTDGAEGARRHGLRLRRRGRPRALDRLSQFLRDHALQPFADVRAGRPPAGAGHPCREQRRAMSATAP
jgi:rare lipoprotein A (peptidoglycan hydrolase)